MPKEGVGKAREARSTEPLSGAEARALLGEDQALSLVVYHRDGAEMASLAPSQPVVVGRSAPADLCVADRTLSREHARFTLAGGRVAVEDLGSTNGTWIAGARIERAVIDVGAEVMLGGLVARVQALGARAAAHDVDGEGAFRRRLDEEVTRAQHFRRRFALLAVRAPSASQGAWAALRASIRPIDRLGAYSPDTTLVLLPEAEREAAVETARVIARDRGDGCRVGVALYPDAASSAEELVEVARRAAAQGGAVEVAATAPWSESRAQGAAPIVAGAAMRALLDTASRVAASRIPVILHGETGTGKELLARFIHEEGPRRYRRMVRVNCAAIPHALVESTLFGHEKGAFTGALTQQKGVFEEADRGSVFLDEIGELPLAAQAALLRVLETGSFSRVGSSRELAVDVRVIAASHRDLEGMADQGDFRADLYYRLSTMTLAIPPLRERADEIEPLSERFLRLANDANGRRIAGISGAAMELLRAYRWPGNVRELRNAIDRAVVVARGELVQPEDLPARVSAARDASAPAAAPPEAKARVKDYEARLLEEALRASGWNRAEAARRLGMPVRTLSYRMKVLGLKKLDP